MISDISQPIIHQLIHSKKAGKTLQVPLNEKNWLISPPPSPPSGWHRGTEGKISQTLPFFDLPPPRLIESSADGTLTFLLYQPNETHTLSDSEETNESSDNELQRPTITLCAEL
jgi:hypothetical protein